MGCEAEKIKYKMSVQDEHGYWSSVSEQKKNLSNLLKPKKQGKNMSVEDELIAKEEMLKHLKANPPIFFWSQDGAKFKRNSLGKYSRDYGDGLPPEIPENGYDLEFFHNNRNYSMFPRTEIWKVKKDTIYAAIGAVEDGLEFAKSCLEEHDLNLGRTTKKNKCWAETIEGSIRHIELTLKLLKDCPENGN